jgi:hypothetical protein
MQTNLLIKNFSSGLGMLSQQIGICLSFAQEKLWGGELIA